MIRSRSNEAQRFPLPGERKKPKIYSYRDENSSEVEVLADQRRQLVFWLLVETRQSYAELTGRLLLVLLSSCLLLIALALIPTIHGLGLGFINWSIRLIFILVEVITAFFLLGSSGFALYGAAFTLQPGACYSLPGEQVSRRQTILQALADLERLRQAERKASYALRWAAYLFLPALFLFTIGIIALVI